MNTKLLLWAFAALSIGSSAYAADSKSEMDGCQHPCPMMSDGSKMDDMHKGMGMGDNKKMDDMHKGMDMGDKKKAGQEYSTKGKVTAVKDSSIAIAHEPVPALQWPAMSMEFGLAKPDIAKGVKPGDAVSVRFVERNGKYVVTHLTKTK